MFSALIIALAFSTAQVDYTYQSGNAVFLPDRTFILCSTCPSVSHKKKEEKPYLASTTPQKSTSPLFLDFNDIVPHSVSNAETNAKQDIVEVKVNKDSKSANCEVNKVLVNFNFDSAELSNSAKQILDTLDVSYPYTVTGFTCSVGQKDYNNKLAKRRAESVADYLRQKGVKIESVSGKGSCCYLEQELSNSAKNRRAEAVRQCK
jgi:outer membrane protein OmpA-like peptidoglycan-associated protein